jgi:hypothetical protein
MYKHQKKNNKFFLNKFTLYEDLTSNRYLIIGSNRLETIFRILNIDIQNPENRHAPFKIYEDNLIFSKTEILNILSQLKIKKIITTLGFFGIMNFITEGKPDYLNTPNVSNNSQFLGDLYLVCITDTTQMSCLRRALC